MFHGVTFMQGAALAISSLSVVTKEALYHYTLRVGEGSNSDSVSTAIQDVTYTIRCNAVCYERYNTVNVFILKQD